MRVAELLGERVEARGVARDEHEVVAAIGEGEREGAPDPGRRAGDEGNGRVSVLMKPPEIATAPVLLQAERGGDRVERGGDRLADLAPRRSRGADP